MHLYVFMFLVACKGEAATILYAAHLMRNEVKQLARRGLVPPTVACNVMSGNKSDRTQVRVNQEQIASNGNVRQTCN